MNLSILALLTIVGCGYSNPIYYGTKLERVEYPFLALLKGTVVEHDYIRNGIITETKICGGSLISIRSVLTAAHCLDFSIGEPTIDVYIGVLRKPIVEHNGQHRRMITYEIHPDYVNKNIDLAIIYMKKPFQVEQGKVEIGQFARVPSETLLVIAGWGVKEFNKKTSSLRTATMMLTKGNNCEPTSGSADDYICMINPGRKSTFCNGDSGGPTIYNNKIVGVISESKDEIILHKGRRMEVCSGRMPSLAVDTSKHIEWIRMNQ